MVNLESAGLFSSCGVDDIGFARAGFWCRVLVEIDERRLAVALRTHPDASGVAGDLRTPCRQVVAAYRKRCGGVQPDLLSAWPPCRGTASARSRRRHGSDAGSRSARDLPVDLVVAVANEIEPRRLVVGNEPAFWTCFIKAVGFKDHCCDIGAIAGVGSLGARPWR